MHDVDGRAGCASERECPRRGDRLDIGGRDIGVVARRVLPRRSASATPLEQDGVLAVDLEHAAGAAMTRSASNSARSSSRKSNTMKAFNVATPASIVAGSSASGSSA